MFTAYMKTAVGFTALALSSVLAAGEVTIPYEFSAGTPAVADEVNANFDAVAGAINDNHQRINGLEGTSTATQDHINDTSLHHQRYSDIEAVGAMGTKDSSNALHHDRYANSEAVGAMGTKANTNPLNHDRYSNDEAVGAMGARDDANALHHNRYNNGEAVGAMGAKANANPLNHDRYADSEALSAVESAGLFQPALLRTLVVSPSGSATANGTQLLAALASITDASDTNRYLIKLEPGVYDIASTVLQLKPFVIIEGSGSQWTRITGTVSATYTGLVLMSSSSGLRWLTLENTNGTNGIYADGASDFFLDGIYISVSSAQPVRGMRIYRSVFSIKDSTLMASSSGTTGYCDGIFVYDTTINLQNTISLGSGCGRATGIWFYNSYGDITGLDARGENSTVTHGVLTMVSSAVTTYSVQIRNSRLKGETNSVNPSGTFNVSIATSQLIGGPVGDTIGTITCIASFDENFTNSGGYSACP